MERVLAEFIAALRCVDDDLTAERLLRELFTKKELATLELRWRLLNDLFDGMSQRKIAERYRISLCKITRGSKVLKKRGSAVRKIFETMKGGEHEHDRKERHPSR